MGLNQEFEKLHKLAGKRPNSLSTSYQIKIKAQNELGFLNVKINYFLINLPETNPFRLETLYMYKPEFKLAIFILAVV